MTLELTRWDIVDHLATEAEQLAYLEVVFEGGDTASIAAALADVARARRMSVPVAAVADVPSLIRTMKALGLELTAKAA